MSVIINLMMNQAKLICHLVLCKMLLHVHIFKYV